MKTPASGPETIDEYIATFPQDVQSLLEQLRQTIRKAAPEATEKISYQMPTFHFHGNLVHFAAYKLHVGFYPTPGGINAFQEERKNYKTSKGAVQFPITEPLPLKLIAKIVRLRVNENSAATAENKKRS